MVKKRKYITDKQWEKLSEITENLNFVVRKNYPIEDIMFWLESANDFREKLKKVV